jgi:pimeloyl-ACP methyl ester carboxylesterase
MNAVVRQSGGDSPAIRPFEVNVPEAELADMRRRIAATRFPGKDQDGDPAPGLPLATLQKLARYWATDYDWRKVEAKLNSYPNFITEIDGLDIHFIHARSKHENALPLIVTHGWPGSVIEQLKIIEPLIDPTAHGGKASDAFHVVMPSMAGYGFSGKPGKSGWDTTRMARAWAVLMKRLGYTRYVAQGGDWGAHVTEQMGVLAPPELLGIHINFASAVPPEVLKGLQSGTTPCGLSAEESRAFERLAFFFTRGLSYAQQMATHPQALCGLIDSPVGLAAWLLDNELWNYELISSAADGRRDGLTRDDILDDITLYWLTDTALSSARLYREHKLPFFARMGVEIPVAVSAFPDEIYQVPCNWAERAYPRLIHYNKVEKGGHFAAWEQPALFSAELRAAFSSLRGTTRSAHATYISGSCL